EVPAVEVGERPTVAARGRVDQARVDGRLGGRRRAAQRHRRSARHGDQSQAAPAPRASARRGVAYAPLSTKSTRTRLAYASARAARTIRARDPMGTLIRASASAPKRTPLCGLAPPML